ncbi:MAG: LytR/AlgR family response regulator transcription factor, partial [Acutalibacteraceae bacterium]
MKILICDDEKSIADNIKEMVSQHLKKKNIEAEIDVFYSTAEIAKKETQYNMAFLDVQIDELDGTEVAKILRKNNPHIILFIITAFDRYLDSAMDINVFRFITKPIEKIRLENSIDKALKMIDNSTIEMILKNSKENVVLSTEDIMCIEIDGRKTTVISTRGIFDSSESIRDWRKKL